MTVQAVANIGGFLDRTRFARAADWLAVAVAISFPWSTSATGILIVLWLFAALPTLDLQALRRIFVLPAAAFPIALFAMGVIGLAWSDANLEDQYSCIKQFPRLLVVPLLFIQFRNSDRGVWVVGGFLVSCTALLALSWFLTMWPALSRYPFWYPGVPVKDYIIQSSEFVICAFALAHLAISAWRDGRRGVAVGLALFALIFLLNIVFVATARSTLIVFAVLITVLAFQRFDWKGIAAVLGLGVVLAGLAWTSSPYLRERVLAVAKEIHDYRTSDAPTSSGFRLEFWKKSIQFVAAAPLFGHGTGSVKGMFRNVASGGGDGASAGVTDQPHNQTFLIAIQIGFVGAALLFAVWISHLLLFRGGGLAAWLGMGIVVQNVVLGLFNSYLFEFTLGWVYIFGVGVLGGMVLRQSGIEEARAANSAVAPGGEGR